MSTDINSEDHLAQTTLTGRLHDMPGWENVYARDQETFGVGGALSVIGERDVVPVAARSRRCLTTKRQRLHACAGWLMRTGNTK